jgi:hypothetical protein
MAGAAVVAYIVGEGLTDAAHAGDDQEEPGKDHIIPNYFE